MALFSTQLLCCLAVIQPSAHMNYNMLEHHELTSNVADIVETDRFSTNYCLHDFKVSQNFVAVSKEAFNSRHCSCLLYRHLKTVLHKACSEMEALFCALSVPNVITFS